MIKTTGIILIAGVLGGCSIGIEKGKTYPSDTFTVDIGYQEAYRRAGEQPRECLDGPAVSGDLFTDNKTGVIRVGIPPHSTRDWLRVDVAALSDASTEVTVTVMDFGMYDVGMMQAMRQSIETNKVVCRDPRYRKFE